MIFVLLYLHFVVVIFKISTMYFSLDQGCVWNKGFQQDIFS